MARNERAPSDLDAEGVPDLEGPLPEKEATGDPQEGLAPPNDKPRASKDWGVTAAEERSGEPLDVRVGREEPDDERPRRENVTLTATGEDDPASGGVDEEAESVADEVFDDGLLGPEEQALHVERER